MALSDVEMPEAVVMVLFRLYVQTSEVMVLPSLETEPLNVLVSAPPTTGIALVPPKEVPFQEIVKDSVKPP